MTQKKVRCAVYTRKSTDEGLEKEFNTLEAQREACENFIKNRVYEGWEVIPTHYDDGGFSGGNINRPGLKQLFEDIQNKKVDMIVVYKIDRLTRSLVDFSKLIEVLDTNQCSFVSVTQQFNTADSTGRLMLNVLLSFAQFEREISGERIRDKIAASKKKGMWMDGSLPLGYDTVNKKLVINEEEAEIVRFIYEKYAVLKSEMKVAHLANKYGFRMKLRKTKDGREIGGQAFSLGSVNGILRNPIYIGKIPFKDEVYEGQHEAIISKEVWERTQNIKSNNRRDRFGPECQKKNNLLKGLLECECCGTAMVPSSSKKGNKYYEYYTSTQAIKNGYDTCSLGNIPAAELDDFVISKIQMLFKSPEIVKELSRKV